MKLGTPISDIMCPRNCIIIGDNTIEFDECNVVMGNQPKHTIGGRRFDFRILTTADWAYKLPTSARNISKITVNLNGTYVVVANFFGTALDISTIDDKVIVDICGFGELTVV